MPGFTERGVTRTAIWHDKVSFPFRTRLG